MTSFKQSKRLAVVAACVGATALAAGPAAAQQPSSATINGTIWSPVYGSHTWTLTLQGLSYSYGQPPTNYDEGRMTSVYATSFDFEFQGPHATELNANVSDPLVNGGLQDGPFIELINYKLWESGSDWYYVSDWFIRIQPSDYQQELRFYSTTYWGYEWTQFTTGANGYPVLAPFTSVDAYIFLTDNRNQPDFGYTMYMYPNATVSLSSVGFSLPGDFDNDRDVDGSDFLAWQRNPSIGDLADWQTNFGASPGLAAATSPVPEPASLLLLALAIPALRRSGSKSPRL